MKRAVEEEEEEEAEGEKKRPKQTVFSAVWADRRDREVEERGCTGFDFGGCLKKKKKKRFDDPDDITVCSLKYNLHTLLILLK